MSTDANESLCHHPSSSVSAICFLHTHTHIYMSSWILDEDFLSCWFFYKFFILIFSSALRLAPNQPQGRCFYWLAYACAIQRFFMYRAAFWKALKQLFLSFQLACHNFVHLIPLSYHPTHLIWQKKIFNGS